MTIRIDLDAIQSKYEANGNDPDGLYLFILPSIGRDLLLSIIERLEYRATYRKGRVDLSESDYDEVRARVAQTTSGLMRGYSVNEIIALLQQILAQVTQGNPAFPGTFEDMCCYLDSQDVTEPAASENPPPGGGGGGYDAELCKAAQAAHDSGLPFLTDGFDMIEILGSISASAIAALIGSIIAMPVALVGILIGAFALLALDELGDDVIAAWVAIKHDIVCAIATATSATNAKTAVHEVIDDYVAEGDLHPAIATLFKSIYNLGTINRIWDGEVDSTGYSETYCDDCDEPEVEYGAVVGAYWEVTAFSATPTNNDLEGIGWDNGATSNDFVNIEGHKDNDPGPCTGSYAIVPAGFTGGAMATNQYEHAPASIAVYRLEVGAWSRASGSATFTGTFTNFKFIREIVGGGYGLQDPATVAIGTPVTGFSMDVPGVLEMNVTYTGNTGGVVRTVPIIFTLP